MINVLLGLILAGSLCDNSPQDKTTETTARSSVGRVAEACWEGPPVKNPNVGTNRIPTMPDKLAGRKVKNTVVVFRGCVDAKGTVVKVLTARSSGDAEVDKFYRDAIVAWKVKPAIRDGKAVPSVLTVVVTISII